MELIDYTNKWVTGEIQEDLAMVAGGVVCLLLALVAWRWGSSESARAIILPLTVMAQNVALILNYCVRFYDRQFITREPVDSQLMQRFTVLLDDYFARGLAARQGVPTVRYFADALNLSANYFGDLVKAQTGNSPQQLIQQHLIAQARHRLTTTTDTVSQIAYALGFEYPQYFSRLFKKQTGLTPQEFRAQA